MVKNWQALISHDDKKFLFIASCAMRILFPQQFSLSNARQSLNANFGSSDANSDAGIYGEDKTGADAFRQEALHLKQ
ncbi:conserved hypothetical protein [Ricinus communis]|uniref:Uncharacterized protein n=1 Tax=Ricinus communis TaxID=3988 RepID=B9RKP5_RICCO|nr:conserved hypothetical protein [Ricinus communis]